MGLRRRCPHYHRYHSQQEPGNGRTSQDRWRDIWIKNRCKVGCKEGPFVAESGIRFPPQRFFKGSQRAIHVNRCEKCRCCHPQEMKPADDWRPENQPQWQADYHESDPQEVNYHYQISKYDNSPPCYVTGYGSIRLRQRLRRDKSVYRCVRSPYLL